MRWQPRVPMARYTFTSGLKVGDIVAHNHRVWRVHQINPIPEVDVKGRRDTAVVLRPIEVTSDTTAHSDDRHLAASRMCDWHVYPDEHYPVCAKCHEPMPCRESEIEADVVRSSERLSRFEIPGVCPACSEPVTTRHLRQTWPENLVALTGQPVTFHLRRKCVDEAKEYDALWRKTGRPSQLGYEQAG